MPMHESHGLAGRLSIELRDASGRLVDARRVNNLITSAGRALLARLFTGSAQSPDLQIAVGRSAAPAQVTDTALGDFVVAAPATIPSVASGDYEGQPRVIARVVATLPPTGSADPQPLQEAGILISVTGAKPVLYNRVTFPVVNRAGNLEMTLSWEVIF